MPWHLKLQAVSTTTVGFAIIGAVGALGPCVDPHPTNAILSLGEQFLHSGGPTPEPLTWPCPAQAAASILTEQRRRLCGVQLPLHQAAHAV